MAEVVGYPSSFAAGGLKPVITSDPAPIAGQGYSLVFFDDFNTLDANATGALSDSKRWGKVWYQSNWPSNRVYTQDSILHMVTLASDQTEVGISTRRSTGPTLSGGSVTSMGASTAFIYGYFEARMLQPSGIGSTYPQWWLFALLHSFGEDCNKASPYTDGTADQAWTGEIDIVEGGWGATGYTPPQKYNTTIHSNTGGAGGPSPCGGADSHPTDFNDLGASVDTFHRYAVLWTSTTVKFYQDEVLTFSTSTFASTFQPLFLILANAGHHSDYGGSFQDSDVQVDWVKVWQNSSGQRWNA